MDDYKEIVKKVNEAVCQIKDNNLKELVCRRLLDDALETASSKQQIPPVQTPHQEKVNKSKKTKMKSRSKGLPYREESVREEVKEAMKDVHGSQKGVVPFINLGKSWKKYLWILEVGRQKGIEAMTNNDIAYILGDKLGEDATEKKVNNLGLKLRDGYVQKWNIDGLKAWKIVKKGTILVSIQTENDTNS